MLDVLVCGSRGWADRATVRNRLSLLPASTRILTGGARGVDRMADEYARERGLGAFVLKPNWKRDGRGAGLKRNIELLNMTPALVLAFWLNGSRGTGHVITHARRRGIRVEVVERWEHVFRTGLQRLTIYPSGRGYVTIQNRSYTAAHALTKPDNIDRWRAAFQEAVAS